jgi:hypothetical protein
MPTQLAAGGLQDMKQDPSSSSSFGRELPSDYIRNDLDDLSTAAAESDLDLHIARLFGLHPSLREQFPAPQLAPLDDAAKAQLLAEINAVLGVLPLHKAEN